MDPALAAMRREYTTGGLSEEQLDPDPLVQFQSWFEAAKQAEIYEPNAMALASVGADGQPSVRIVLLKGLDARGIAFFTNFESRKGRELDARRKAAATFWWGPLERQVRFEGTIERVEDEAADEYFRTRPEGARLGAWASRQSERLPSRSELEAEVKRYEERFAGGEIPRPPFWGGYRLRPHRVEFWQGRQDRLHDRLLYLRDGERDWRIERLSP